MAEFPALPLFTDALLGDTTHLNDAEFGSYMLLIVSSWRSRSCDLPDDDSLLARYARCSLKVWQRSRRAMLAPFFTVADGRWRQKKLLEVRQHVAEVSAKRKAAAGVKHSTSATVASNSPPASLPPGDAKPRKTLAATPANAPANAPANEGASGVLTKSKDLIETHTVEISSSPPTESHTRATPPAKSVVWAELKAWLKEAGVSNPGSLIGRWCQQYGEGQVFAAYFAAGAKDRGERVPYMVGTMKGQRERLAREAKRDPPKPARRNVTDAYTAEDEHLFGPRFPKSSEASAPCSTSRLLN